MALTGKAATTGAGGFISNATPTVLLTNSQGANKICRLDKLVVLNIDTASAVTIEVYLVPSGGAISGDDYKIIKGYSVKASGGLFGTEDIREAAGVILNNGDSIQALAGTASKLKYHLSYWAES